MSYISEGIRIFSVFYFYNCRQKKMIFLGGEKKREQFQQKQQNWNKKSNIIQRWGYKLRPVPTEKKTESKKKEISRGKVEWRKLWNKNLALDSKRKKKKILALFLGDWSSKREWKNDDIFLRLWLISNNLDIRAHGMDVKSRIALVFWR